MSADLGASGPPMGDAVAAGQVRALLFDLGGVLIEIDFGRCMAAWAASGGTATSTITSRFCFDAAYEAHERGALDLAGYLDHLRATLDLELTDDELVDGWNDIYVGLDVEVAALLSTVGSRVPLYAFTNTNPTHQQIWSSLFEEELSVFERVFVSSELGQRKPDLTAFETVASAIGAPCAQILFFDDSAENVEGALAAGMQAVHVTSADSVRAALEARGLVSDQMG